MNLDVHVLHAGSNDVPIKFIHKIYISKRQVTKSPFNQLTDLSDMRFKKNDLWDTYKSLIWLQLNINLSVMRLGSHVCSSCRGIFNYILVCPKQKNKSFIYKCITPGLVCMNVKMK